MSYITDKIVTGQPVYLLNDFEDCVIRIDKGYYVKFRGKKEYQTTHTNHLVCDVLRDLEVKELTKEEYDNF